MMLSSNADRKIVHVASNLDTNVAVTICPLITVKEFKKHCEWEHLNCFRKVGSISVKRLMVKKKGRYYSLPDSVIVGDVFKGSRGHWFLWIQADKQLITNQLRSVIDEGLRKEVATTSEISSVKSVSEIIKKHFSDYNYEAASSPVSSHVTVRKQDNGSLLVSKKVWMNSGGQNKRKKPEVGKRLLVASNNLGVSRCCKPSVLSLLKSNNSYKSKAIARKLVFEIED